MNDTFLELQQTCLCAQNWSLELINISMIGQVQLCIDIHMMMRAIVYTSSTVIIVWMSCTCAMHYLTAKKYINKFSVLAQLTVLFHFRYFLLISCHTVSIRVTLERINNILITINHLIHFLQCSLKFKIIKDYFFYFNPDLAFSITILF